MLLADKIAGRNTTMAIQQKPSTHPRVSITMTSAIRIVVLQILIICCSFPSITLAQKEGNQEFQEGNKEKDRFN